MPDQASIMEICTPLMSGKGRNTMGRTAFIFVMVSILLIAITQCSEKAPPVSTATASLSPTETPGTHRITTVPPTASPSPTQTQEDELSEFERMVDVGGYQLYLHCTGTGTPGVILEAGFDDVSETWSLVQPEVARTTRVGTRWCGFSP